MDWQPIDTAPMDGTRILIFRDGYAESMLTAWWNNDWGMWAVAGTNNAIGHASVTNWMPLPEPPKK